MSIYFSAFLSLFVKCLASNGDFYGPSEENGLGKDINLRSFHNFYFFQGLVKRFAVFVLYIVIIIQHSIWHTCSKSLLIFHV